MVIVVVVVGPGSCLVDVDHFLGVLAGEKPSKCRMPWVSIVVVGVVVGVVEGWLDLTAFGMQEESGIDVVESIAIKPTYRFRNC